MPRRRGGVRGGLSQAAFAASDAFGSLLQNRLRQQDRDQQQARQAPNDLMDFALRQLVPQVNSGQMPVDAASSIYERVAHSLGMVGPQQFDFQQFVQQPDLIGNVLKQGSAAEYRERVPTDTELDFAAQQQGAFSFPLRRSEPGRGDVTTQEGPDISPIRNVLNAQREALPPLREEGKGGRRTVTTVNAKGQKVEQLIDDQGAVVAEFLSPPDKPAQPAPDPNAPKPFRDSPELPQGVLQYVFELKQKHKDAASAQKEIANQMPKLLQAHPNLNPVKLKQAIDQMFRQPGQALVIPPEMLSQVFGGGGS